jgi:mutator protein MutT
MIKVVAAIIRKGDNVLIAHRASHKSLPGKWEFPGGKVEDGENEKDALKRELYEEFSVETEVMDFVGSNIHHYDDFSIELSAFKVNIVCGNLTLTDHDMIAWVNSENLGNYDIAEADIPLTKLVLAK